MCAPRVLGSGASGSPTVILIGQYDSPFVRRVAIALTHYGLAYEHRPWSVWAEADALAEFNPLRRVPVLVVDGGEALVESSAILDAIDDMVPAERALVPRSGATRRATLRICALATGLADKAVSLLYEGVLRKEAARSPRWIERCRGQIEDTLRRLESERAAKGGEFWFGAFSHADIAVASALRFLGEAHAAIWAEADYPALAADARRCEATALFQRIVQPLRVQVSA
jgi:glutathione S-transferase